VSEAKLMGHGVSACATATPSSSKNSASSWWRRDTALEEAQFLTKIASSVKIVHRRDALRVEIMQDRAFGIQDPFIWDSIVEEVFGPDGKVTGVKLRNLKSTVVSTPRGRGMFIGIGHQPNTKLFEGQLTSCPAATSAPSADAHGVARSIRRRRRPGFPRTARRSPRRGAGCMALSTPERYIEELKHQTTRCPRPMPSAGKKASTK